MNISAPFIFRPVATTLLTLGVALAGGRGILSSAGFAFAASRFSDNFGTGQSAGGFA